MYKDRFIRVVVFAVWTLNTDSPSILSRFRNSFSLPVQSCESQKHNSQLSEKKWPGVDFMQIRSGSYVLLTDPDVAACPLPSPDAHLHGNVTPRECSNCDWASFPLTHFRLLLLFQHVEQNQKRLTEEVCKYVHPPSASVGSMVVHTVSSFLCCSNFSKFLRNSFLMFIISNSNMLCSVLVAIVWRTQRNSTQWHRNPTTI